MPGLSLRRFALGVSVFAWVFLLGGFGATYVFLTGHAARLAVMSPRTFFQVMLLFASTALAGLGVVLSSAALARNHRAAEAWFALSLGLLLVLPMLGLYLWSRFH